MSGSMGARRNRARRAGRREGVSGVAPGPRLVTARSRHLRKVATAEEESERAWSASGAARKTLGSRRHCNARAAAVAEGRREPAGGEASPLPPTGAVC